MAVRYVDRVGLQLDSVAASTSVVTISVAAEVGQFLLLAARSGQSLAISSVTDSAGNTWTKVDNSEAINAVSSLWRCTVTSRLAVSSTVTVTFTGSTSTTRQTGIWAFDGVTRPSVTTQTARGTAVASLSVSSVSPEQQGSLLFTAFANVNISTFTISSGWTLLSAGDRLGAAYAISSMSALGVTWTATSASNCGSVLATLTPDGGDFLALF